MDAVQHILQSYEAAAATSKALERADDADTNQNSLHANSGSSASPRGISATKLVFVYSDDDEDDDPCSNAGSPASPIPVSEEVLAELRTEAAEANAPADSGFPGFTEDLVGGCDDSSALLGGMRGVRVVPSEPLTAPQDRRCLTVSDLSSAAVARKRFRAERDEEGDVGGNDSDAESVDVMKAEFEEYNYLAPVLAADGVTVAAVRSGAYTLTVNEQDLLADDGDEGDDYPVHDDYDVHEDKEEGGSGDALDSILSGVAMPDGDGMDLHAAVDGGFGDFDDDEEDEESDDGLDDALVVAVAEQLVRCCEAEDRDPALDVEAARFLAAVKPLLKELLEDKSIEAAEFATRVDYDLRRFQRIFRAVYRPRDEPIVIDGVKMDM